MKKLIMNSDYLSISSASSGQRTDLSNYYSFIDEIEY
jgi:hypothetical protein